MLCAADNGKPEREDVTLWLPEADGRTSGRRGVTSVAVFALTGVTEEGNPERGDVTLWLPEADGSTSG